MDMISEDKLIDRAKKTLRDKEILEAFLGGENKAEIGRRVKLTRERVGQIVEEMTLSRSPEWIAGLRVDWKKLNSLRRELEISHNRIAQRTGRSISTVIRVMNGDPLYINTPAALDVVTGLVQEANELLEYIEEVLETVRVDGTDK